MLAPILAPLLALQLSAGPDLTTTAERTGFRETGRYDEAVRLCRGLAAAYPARARCLTFGETPEGRPLVALVASAGGGLDARAARAARRPVVLLQGGIHAAEIDGKDAGFLVLRELLASRDGGPLAKVTAVFVPVLNADGHERFGPNHRPNQRGPEASGWRTTAQNLNLNRDYVAAQAPETQAVLRLMDAWDPIALGDLHVTDGAQFQHDLAVMVEPRQGYSPAMREEGAALSAALVERLAAAGHLPLDFYPSLREYGDPASGFAPYPAPIRFGHGYWAARNRFGILLETHSWRPYPHRVKATAHFVRALLDLAAERGGRWRAAADRADREGAAARGREVELGWAPGSRTRPLAFQGYAYVREDSPVLGKKVPRYDETRPEVWNVPVVDERVVTARARVPMGGWIVPAAHAGWVAGKLRLHGIAFERMASRRAAAQVEAFRATAVEVKAQSFEGRHQTALTGAWAPEARDLAAGWLWIPSAQPLAPLAAMLLDPAGPDAFVAWGAFATAFEKKEYIEDYVLEPWARALLARDPAVKAEFERRLADPAFAKDPAARLDFFWRRHPAHDEAYRLYPVLRADRRP
ncbi:peptidase M14 carboxypeptidase A [Anaeromyxobacter sp. K]|uniref:M14 family zinc carboxypeptidase n=1 Tax=Anaeromyxobacter sp. (strain K) TaxID=447217 RepID=UPI00015F9AB5|nr:M14 family zinc carboxypeptidase [Anaeromyxobacter sp. K]ACG71361.1 peptidase M14 carboxypeptidase A [Anaeromyxobacter sp. K]